MDFSNGNLNPEVKMKLLNAIIAALCVTVVSSLTFAENTGKLEERARNASVILAEATTSADHAIPESLLAHAECIAAIPHVIRAGWGIGGRYGKGLVSCRTAWGWSTPSFVSLTGGSFGLQIGLSATDLVLVFVRSSAVNELSRNDFTMGGDASVAAGPLGRHAEAGTDYKLNSEIYAYSKSRGLFAGLTVGGAILHPDDDANSAIYGGSPSVKALLTSDGHEAPSTVRAFVHALYMAAPHR
jgi:SH3 domain-containing YSC84-like protein 1